MQRLLVEAPESLSGGEWKSHVETCAECHAARESLERSLAVYRQLEREFLDATPLVPGWDRFSAHLAQRNAELRISRRRGAWGMVVAVVSVSLVTLGSTLHFSSLETHGPSPARIVRVSALQREHLVQSLRNILAENSIPKAAAAPQIKAPSMAPPRLNSSVPPVAVQPQVPVILVSYPRSPSISPVYTATWTKAAGGEGTVGVGATGFTMFPHQPQAPMFPR